MQTKSFKWKLFNIEYTTINSSILLWGKERIDAEYFDAEYIKNELKIENKNYSTLESFWKVDASAFYPAATHLYEKWDIPFARCVDVVNYFIIDDKQEFEKIPSEFLDENKNIKIAYPWDIIITKVWTPCFAWLVNSSFKNWVALSRTVLWVLNIESINSYYLLALLRWYYWFSQLLRERELTIQYQLTLDRVRNIKIPIPSDSFQKQIEKLVIESYNQKELSEKLYKESEELLLKEIWLLNYQTSRKNIILDWGYKIEVEENHSTTNYSILKKLDRFDAEYWDYKYFDIKNKLKWIKTEKLWDLIKYKKWIEVWTWKYIEESEIETTENKKFFVRVSNFSKFWMNFNNSKFITNETFEELENYQPQKWEILFSKDWTAWITYLLREDIEWIISWWIIRLQNISVYSSEYIELVLNSFLIQSEIERQTNWALIQHLKITDALNFDIPIIDDKKIKEITIKIKESFEAKNKSKNLLEVAKKAVEIYIEQDENKWLDYIKNNS